MLGSAPVSILGSGCSSVWLERYLGVVEVASSNLVTPTINVMKRVQYEFAIVISVNINWLCLIAHIYL